MGILGAGGCIRARSDGYKKVDLDGGFLFLFYILSSLIPCEEIVKILCGLLVDYLRLIPLLNSHHYLSYHPTHSQPAHTHIIVILTVPFHSTSPLHFICHLIITLANMPSTQTINRSPPTAHPRVMTNNKSPSKIPVAYPTYVATTPTPKRSSGSSTHTSAVPSLVSDSGSGRGSSDGGMSDVDLLDMLDLKLSHSVKPEPLDRGLAKQAQA